MKLTSQWYLVLVLRGVLVLEPPQADKGGHVTDDNLLTIRCGENSVVTQTLIHKLATAWREPSTAQTHGKS